MSACTETSCPSNPLAAQYYGYALNIAIGVQLILGALITGIAAATTVRQVSTLTSSFTALGNRGPLCAHAFNENACIGFGVP